jgi:large subunit ribosomal protein L25
MSQITLKVSSRAGSGRGACRRLRAAGGIPAVVYGRSGSRTLAVAEVDFRTLSKQIKGRSALIEICQEGVEPTLSIIQEVQRNPRTDQYLHIDFHEVATGELISTHTSIHVVGESVGVKSEDALLEIHTHEVDVRCLPLDLPEFIEIDVTNLHVGESIHLRDLTPPPRVEFLEDESVVLVSCMAFVVADAEKKEEEAEVDVEGEAAEGAEAEEDGA